MEEISLPEEHSQRAIGPYAIIEEINESAHSVVYKARDPRHRLVALKALRQEVARNPRDLERFNSEAFSLERIDHPNVARIIDHGLQKTSGSPYIAMEFIEGPTVERLILDKAPLTPFHVLDLILGTCEGLRAALRENIIHRDIKPGNLLVHSATHQVKIVDFGLAKFLWPEPNSDAPAVSALSAAHPPPRQIVGTPRYMSPEHCQGHGLDIRSDIYSIGATFYHVLAGQPPFDASTNGKIMEQILHSDAVHLGAINPDVPQEICEIIMRMLARNPIERYQDYDTVIADLDAAKLAEASRVKRQEDQAAQQETELDKTDPPRGEGEAPVGANLDRILDREKWEQYRNAQRRKKRHPVLFTFIILLFLTIGGIFALGGLSQPNLDAGIVQRVCFSIVKLVRPGAILAMEMKDNHDKMTRVIEAIALFRAKNKNIPLTITQLSAAALLEDNECRDAWGNYFQIEPNRRALISLGADGLEETGDDWALSFNGKILNAPSEFTAVAIAQ